MNREQLDNFSRTLRRRTTGRVPNSTMKRAELDEICLRIKTRNHPKISETSARPGLFSDTSLQNLHQPPLSVGREASYAETLKLTYAPAEELA